MSISGPLHLEVMCVEILVDHLESCVCASVYMCVCVCERVCVCMYACMCMNVVCVWHGDLHVWYACAIHITCMHNVMCVRVLAAGWVITCPSEAGCQ